MFAWLNILILFVIGDIVTSNICIPITFSLNPVPANEAAFATNPINDDTGLSCNNLGSQTIILKTDFGYHFEILFIQAKNFTSNKASLTFIDGTISGVTPFCELSEDLLPPFTEYKCSSLTNQIMITYQLDPKLTDNLPVFDIRAQSSMASNAAIASTTTTILPTTLPRAIDSKLLQSDIAIILDTSSQDNALLQKTATDIISALTIDTVLPNLYSRVNLMLLGENSATVTGWTLPKAILLASIKIATRIDKKASITIPNFVNPFEGAFQQSVMERPNVQRIAIFITDNNLQHGDPGTRLKGNQVVKQNDIHSILVSINPTLKAETDFSTISKAFTGVNSNELIAHDFVSKDNLFENVLLNGNVLCNFGSIIKSSNQDSAFTFPFQNEDAPFITNYCNNMHFSFKCANENDLLPISVAMTHYSLELDKDYVQIYDDTDSTDPEAVFNGIHDSNTINSIQSYFINFKITTDFNGVFKGFNAAFTNCKILA